MHDRPASSVHAVQCSIGAARLIEHLRRFIIIHSSQFAAHYQLNDGMAANG